MSFSIEDNLYTYFKTFYNNRSQMFKSFFGRIYRRIPDSLRYGETYNRYLSLLEKSQWWSKEKILEFQWRKIENLLNHAYKNVPYYTRLLDEGGFRQIIYRIFNRF